MSKEFRDWIGHPFTQRLIKHGVALAIAACAYLSWIDEVE